MDEEQGFKPKTCRLWQVEPWQLKALKDLMEGPQVSLLEALLKEASKSAQSKLEQSEDLHEMLRAQGALAALSGFRAKLAKMYSDMQKEA